MDDFLLRPLGIYIFHVGNSYKQFQHWQERIAASYEKQLSNPQKCA